MNHEFKPGDLAIVVGCRRDPVNIGCQCELIQKMHPGELALHPLDQNHVVRLSPDDESCWLVVGDSLQAAVSGQRGFALIAQRHLRPLRGDFQPEREREKELTE